MNRYDEIAAALQAPFPAHEVLERSEQGRTLHYINAASAQQRLDDVLGPAGWRPTYREVGKGVECTIEVYFEDAGGWLAKPDVGGYPGMTRKVRDPDTREMTTEADDENDIKGAYSDAFKRAASAWGVGRYLRFKGRPAAPLPNRPAPPPNHAQAPPPQQAATPAPAPRTHVNGEPHRDAPRTGKALFGWSKDREQEYQVGLIKYLNGWAKLQDFPSRMVEWNEAQVAQAYAEACRKLQSIRSGQGDAQAYEEALAN